MVETEPATSIEQSIAVEDSAASWQRIMDEGSQPSLLHPSWSLEVGEYAVSSRRAVGSPLVILVACVIR